MWDIIKGEEKEYTVSVAAEKKELKTTAKKALIVREGEAARFSVAPPQATQRPPPFAHTHTHTHTHTPRTSERARH